MWIKSINLKNVYSFGKSGTPELKDFTQFNLFIGKNGSGKSNVFRAICNLDVLHQYDINTNMYTYILNYESRNKNIVSELQAKTSDSFPNIIIELENYNIEFKNGYHISGDFKSNSGNHLMLNPSKSLFIEKLHEINRTKKWTPFLDFALFYIFDLDIFFSNGKIQEWFTIREGENQSSQGRPANFDNWSSGFFSICNLLINFFSVDKKIICIDEPEVHLEPRSIRKLIEIILWISLKDNTNTNYKLITAINNKWSSWLNKSIWKDTTDLENTLDHFKFKQIFICSHSSVLINEFIKYQEICSIYEFNRSLDDTSFSVGFDKHKQEINQKSIVSHIRKINGYPHSILDNLGANGSDLLQTNGVVWVEGPSDIIYIKKWLDMHAEQNDLPKLKQGNHYEFQMYGGTLLDSICFIKEKESIDKNEEIKKLVSMFSFSRNAFVITDSDAVLKENGSIVDQSKFKKAKDYILQEFEKLTEQNYSLGLWYKKNNIDIRTLENYLDQETIENFNEQKDSSLTKKIYAQKVTSSWDNKTKLLSEFNYSLSDEIKILYETIIKWNE